MSRKGYYLRYLESGHWKSIRRLAFERDGWKCIKCGSENNLEGHHIRYRKNLRSCTENDIETLCVSCHREKHRIAKKQRRLARSPRKPKHENESKACRAWVNGHQQLKALLLQFWSQFGGRKGNGVGFNADVKLEALIKLARTTISYVKQQPLGQRREQFNEAKLSLHPWRRFGLCFVCGKVATARHHIVPLNHGGINSRKNIISVCDACHGRIHPWLKTTHLNTEPSISHQVLRYV